MCLKLQILYAIPRYFLLVFQVSDYLEFYFVSEHFLDRVVQIPHQINIYKVSTIVLHFVLVISDIISTNLQRCWCNTFNALLHSLIVFLPWKPYSWLTMTIMHHIEWSHSHWIRVRKDGDDHRKSYFWSISQVYGLKCLSLPVAIDSNLNADSYFNSSSNR